MTAMRHLVQAVVIGLAIGSASTAYAVDHLMKIAEVGLSKGGDPAVQFIELEDPFGESFPNNPYTLELFDADAGLLGSVSLTIPGGTTRYLVATAAADTAYGTTADAELTVSLPVDGQACFTRGTFRIHCVAWGCVDTPLVGAQRIPSPPDNMSAQRQSNGMYQLATPTPDADNQAGAMAAACPADPDAAPAVDGPIDAGPIDALDPSGDDAGTDDRNDDDDTDGGGGGCCEVDGTQGAFGSGLLAVGLLLALRRRSRRAVKLGSAATPGEDR